MTQLSPHFTLEELAYSDTALAKGINNTPTLDAGVQLVLLCNNTLERVRLICGGHPVIVSSGFRCPELNRAVGGATDSAHLYGCAADLTIPSFGTPQDICHALIPYIDDLEIDQLIWEMTWVHIGRAPNWGSPRYQQLTIANGYTTTGIA